ncbi:MAG: hypothetical protein LBJ21_04450 [Acidobacteriota bacterium]|jgi:hypothetical protein|nr:hypothetical protein [Acidobacteriota bacterium]
MLSDFEKQQKETSLNFGMPNLRIQYFRGPVWGKTNDQLKKQIVEGNNPINGKPVMREMVELLTIPLKADEQRTGEIQPDTGPATYTGTPEELQKLFREKRYTDFLPVILPTREKVDEMLAQTSHNPDMILGRMNPGSEAGDTWTYTVRTAAINAVMAGADPEYFPIILAIGSAGMTAVNVSDNGFAAGAVINGKIRDEVGLNYEEGAVGPYAHANTTIGRAWSLLSINGGNCGKVGTTYMGTVGNPMNLINIIIAENEERSPFEPLSVRRGFKKDENVVTLFNGWGILSAKNWAATVWGPDMNYPEIIKEIYGTQDGWLFGTAAVLSPPIANFVRDGGFDTVEKFTEWVTGLKPGAKPKSAPGVNLNSGVRRTGGTFNVIVTGGSNNNYFSMGGMVPSQSVQIDKWR